jgi:hypothetical protein
MACPKIWVGHSYFGEAVGRLFVWLSLYSTGKGAKSIIR